MGVILASINSVFTAVLLSEKTNKPAGKGKTDNEQVRCVPREYGSGAVHEQGTASSALCPPSSPHDGDGDGEERKRARLGIPNSPAPKR